MKHPFYCVSNSLVILRKYWSQESYDKCVNIQNQPFHNNPYLQSTIEQEQQYQQQPNNMMQV
jgi:hypothetical protein